MKLFSSSPSASFLVLVLILALSGCELAAVGESEQIANVETILAGTPSATPVPPTPTLTGTPEPTATLTPTVGPSPTASPTPPPTATPLPPTPTPNPALTGFSFCNQRSGSTVGRFSARLTEASASGTPAYEQVVLRFELSEGSAPLGVEASCLSSADLAATRGSVEVPGSYVLRLNLPGWLRDEAFSSSVVSQTLTFSGTRTITAARLVPASTPDAGAELLIGLSEPLPFRLTVERNPTRVILAVARSSTVVSTSDPLRVESPGGAPGLPSPLYVIADGDIWRVEGGLRTAGGGLTPAGTGARNLSESPETETALAVSPDGTTLAFCRAAPGLDPADSELPVPSALWVMGADGSDPRPLAQVGVSCADPAFSPDGTTVAFAVDETGALPTQRAIYTVSINGGTPERATEGVDEWSRSGPQWLADGALVFAATAQDGRSTLFLRRADGQVDEVGAAILVPDGDAPPYAALGRPLAARDGSRFAVEAIRSDGLGADLVVLDAQGAVLERIGGQTELPPATPVPTQGEATPTQRPTRTARPALTASPISGTPAATLTTAASEAPAVTTTPTATATTPPTPEPEPEPEVLRTGPYWTRPLSWDAEGRLLYLSTLCASEVVQDYQLYRWNGRGLNELLLTGQSLGGLGPAAFAGEAMAYVLTEQAPPGLRGPVASTPRGPAALWLWELESGARGALIRSARDFTALAP
ncbi:MAG: PD40 domain-containing protein [Chloroflexi bacterium OHK40]